MRTLVLMWLICAAIALLAVVVGIAALSRLGLRWWRQRRLDRQVAKWSGIGLALMLFLLLAACYDPHAQESAIVREVEGQGAGNISTFTLPGLEQWFGATPQRREFAAHIAEECQPLTQHSGANWQSSAEGSVCLAANRMAAAPTITADKTVF